MRSNIRTENQVQEMRSNIKTKSRKYVQISNRNPIPANAFQYKNRNSILVLHPGRNQSLLQPDSRHCFVKISSRWPHRRWNFALHWRESVSTKLWFLPGWSTSELEILAIRRCSWYNIFMFCAFHTKRMCFEIKNCKTCLWTAQHGAASWKNNR